MPSTVERRTVQRTVCGPNSRYLAVDGVGPTYTLKPAGYALIERMAEDGRDVTSIARALGMHRDTFRLLRRRDPEAQEAIERGRAALGDELADIFLEQARNGNTVAAIYLTKARLGWREAGPVDPNAQASNINITINAPLSDDEWQRMVTVSQEALDGHD